MRLMFSPLENVEKVFTGKFLIEKTQKFHLLSSLIHVRMYWTGTLE